MRVMIEPRCIKGWWLNIQNFHSYERLNTCHGSKGVEFIKQYFFCNTNSYVGSIALLFNLRGIYELLYKAQLNLVR